MKASITLHDNSVVSIKSIHENVIQILNSYNLQINKLLSKYNEAWIGNEHDVILSMMNDCDCAIYTSLFDARQNIKGIAGQMCVLL